MFAVCLILVGCGSDKNVHEYSGQAQGTYFSVKYHKSGHDAEAGLDSIFRAIDNQFSAYIDNSAVTRFNTAHDGATVDSEFLDLWEKCWELNIETDGYFDPTLASVIQLYKEFDKGIDTSRVIESLSQTGMQMITADGDFLSKKVPGIRLDFDGVAQGYTVDVIATYLDLQGVENYLIEVGGEVRTKGKNESGHYWTIGIDDPSAGKNRKIMHKIALHDKSLATSGNYRKFREINGKRIGHIIDPKTGFPAETSLLSVSVVCRDCYRADGLATAFMNMSAQEVIDLSSEMKDIDIFLVYLSAGDTLSFESPNLGRYRDQ